MAHYFARPELHNHESGDYDHLHREMAGAGYYRVMKLNDDHWYDLPTGEYHKHSANLIATERSLVQAAILRVVNNNRNRTKDYWLVLTNSVSTDVSVKLRRATEQSKLPPGERL